MHDHVTTDLWPGSVLDRTSFHTNALKSTKSLQVEDLLNQIQIEPLPWNECKMDVKMPKGESSQIQIDAYWPGS